MAITNKLSTPAIDECQRVLNNTGSNVVWEILRQSDEFVQWDHFPKGDVFDETSHCQYYYHAHDPEEANRLEEHGHFHCFIRQEGIPAHIQPIAVPDNQGDPDKPEETCHLIAISMSNTGEPLRLFTVNRWVTKESWYKAEDVIQCLDLFMIDHAYPSWPTNIWLTEMVKLHKEKIAELVRERDRTLIAWQAAHPDRDAYDDETLEILSIKEIA